MKAGTKTLIALGIGVMLVSYLSTLSHFWGGPPVLGKDDPADPKRLASAARTKGGGRSSTAGQVRHLFKEPSPQIRMALLYGFIDTLEAGEFADAFEAINQHLGHQHSQLQIALLKRWMAIDPRGAWDTIRPMFDYTSPSRYADTWEEKLIPPRDPDKLGHSTFWPRRELLDDFPGHVIESDLPEAEKSQLNSEFLELYREHFDADYTLPSRGQTPHRFPVADLYAQTSDILDAPLDELGTLIDQAARDSNGYAIAIGLRRLVEADPSKAPEALDLISAQAESDALLPTREVMRAWGQQDPDGALQWLQDHRPDSLTGILGQSLIPYLDDQQRKELIDRALPIEGDWPGEFGALLSAWAETDLGSALQAARQLDGDEAASHVAYEVIDDAKTGDQLGEIAETLIADPSFLQDGETAQAMETWGEWNVSSAARFGVKWLLNSGDYPREEVLEVWNGSADPADGLVPDRTFGCLRCWALAQPEEMQSWIDSQASADVRAALQWLFDHPNGN